VFEFNERAIRAYRRSGFAVEGRSRESIWRDGQWWDELAMSMLESDWRRTRNERETSTVEPGGHRRLDPRTRQRGSDEAPQRRLPRWP